MVLRYWNRNNNGIDFSMMPHPCPIFPGNCSCHECWLFKHDARYRKLWGGNPLETDVVPLPLVTQKKILEQVKKRSGNSCWHLGEPLEKTASCGCNGAVKRKCAIFGECRQFGNDTSIANCSTCESYVPRPDPTVDDWIKRLRFGPIIEPSEARIYRHDYTKAIHALLGELNESLPPIPRFEKERGVVTTGGGKYWPGTWVQASILREVGWTGEIQAWYLGEPERNDFWQNELSRLGVTCIDAKDFDKKKNYRKYRILNGFEVKLYAVMNSGIEQPLWLDSDCYPCRPIDSLWDCPTYKENGSIHWPDLANADQWTQWDKWGIEKDDSPPIETGQYLYNLSKCWKEANIALRLNEFSDLVYHWDYGDKGPPRVAWALTKKPRTIYEKVPTWKGPAFLHLGPDKKPMLIHRCRGKVGGRANKFYTPQNHDGWSVHNIPGEAMFHKYNMQANHMVNFAS